MGVPAGQRTRRIAEDYLSAVMMSPRVRFIYFCEDKFNAPVYRCDVTDFRRYKK